ncbi:MAG: hypothetical protein ACI8P0_000164 [Planctomycetaceae bacterium]|jgi:hypothetical protein
MSSVQDKLDKEGPTVFISYSHDSPEHSQRVLELAWTLRDNGCVVELDQFHQHEILDWQRWCRKQVKESRFVVCVCTAEFQRRLNGEVSAEDGKGVFWEGNFLLTEIYNEKGNSRFIPVLLGDEPHSSVDATFGVPTRCRISDFELADLGFEDLIRILTEQPRVVANPVGSIPDLSAQTAPASNATTATTTQQSSRIAPSELPRTGEYLIGRQLELRRLTQAWKNPKTCIVQIVAPGGVGKTQLVKKWREALLDKDDHAGVVRAYDWSFYSQGTQQQASADDFFDRALRWFGEANPENHRDPWTKGERLAELIRQQPTLLILDGMEPLQHPPGPMAGELTDPSIKVLLQGLQRGNPGLCIVTTREAVPTLNELNAPKRVTIDLDRLTPEAGADLLGHYGVTGEPDELRQASIDVDGHALTLILLGTYLKARCGGNVRRRSEALLFQGHERYAAHAHKVMASYEAWFSQQDDTGRAAVAILRLMGLFNRPADAGCLAALRAEPPIPGLTEPLFVGADGERRDEMWQRAIERLRAARLLADDEGNTGTLDAHRLIREHFAIQLNEQPESGREAHRRLYEHLKQSAPELPDNLTDMLQLYHAVEHGCCAGFSQIAIGHTYLDRIRRGEDCFSTRQLGAYSTELVMLGHAFRKKWTETDSGLSPFMAASVAHQAGFCLRALGQSQDAISPLSLGVRLRMEMQDWPKAAGGLLAVAESQSDLGSIGDSIQTLETAVELSDRRKNDHEQSISFYRKSSRAQLGHILALANKPKNALNAFHDAQAVQRLRQPEAPFLYSVDGFVLWDFWLDSADHDLLLYKISLQNERVPGDQLVTCFERCRLVRKEVEQSQVAFKSIFENEPGPLTDGLNQLALARSWMIEHSIASAKMVQTTTPKNCPHLATAAEYAEKAIEFLQTAQNTSEITRAWLLRSAIRRMQLSSRDQSLLTEIENGLLRAETIAERGSMLIWKIEAALERARLFLMLARIEEGSHSYSQIDADNYREQAQQKLDEAKTLIKQTEKPYVPHVPDWDEWEPPEYVGVFKEGDIVGYHCRNGEIERLQKLLDDAGS